MEAASSQADGGSSCTDRSQNTIAFCVKRGMMPLSVVFSGSTSAVLFIGRLL